MCKLICERGSNQGRDGWDFFCVCFREKNEDQIKGKDQNDMEKKNEIQRREQKSDQQIDKFQRIENSIMQTTNQLHGYLWTVGI
jgi:hypothetical protein